MDSATLVGGFAALLHDGFLLPSAKEVLDTGETGDLSLGMLLILTAGLATWVVYGVMRKDVVVITANSISVCLLFGILGFKLREIWSEGLKQKA